MSDISRFLDHHDQTSLASALKKVHPSFDASAFLADITPGLMNIPLKERMRKTTHCVHQHLSLPLDLAFMALINAGPHISGDFTGMVLSDYVEVYGLEHPDLSLPALKELTQYGSAEFAIRPFIKRYPNETMAFLLDLSLDDNHHCRRLASEGTRPRLPWSFHLKDFIKDPSPCWPLLSNLMQDDSLYVRKSVANHLNDISKDNPDLVFDFLKPFDQQNPHTKWITKHALRSLIKDAHPRVFGFLGFSQKPRLKNVSLTLNSDTITMGSYLAYEISLTSDATKSQKLAIDVIVHFMKKNGKQNPKVFKFRELTIKPNETITLDGKRAFVPLTTRKYYAGDHAIELMINGQKSHKQAFNLIF